MELNHQVCYEAVRSSDPRFDGAFFVGVSSTGIYCRTVCTAKTPKPENCTFYPSAAAAEKADYRPCLRCRPELAPGNARIDAAGRIAAAAVGRIEDGALSEVGVEGLASELGITDRHLRRVVREEFGVSPIALAQTQRLLTAKRLLTDTDLSITDVAFASGFSSLRRFNALFQEHYRLNPTALRRSRGAEAPRESLVCEIAYRPPYDWDAMLAFLAPRALPGVESVEGGVYRRTAAVGKRRGWIAVRPSRRRNTLEVEVAASLAPALVPVLARVKRLFDVSADPAAIAERLGPLAEGCPGLRVPGAFDGFETAVRAVLGQQVSVASARKTAGRFAEAFGEPIETPFGDLCVTAPSAATVAGLTRDEIAGAGIIGARAAAILELARAVSAKEIRLTPGGDVEATVARLKEIPGIGDWTAQYIAMRALAWPDAFPHTDLGVRKALGVRGEAEVLAMAEKWRPWRAYAVMHLWRIPQPPGPLPRGPGCGAAFGCSRGEGGDEWLWGRETTSCWFGGEKMTYYGYMDSPIGPLLLTSNGSALTGVYMEDQSHGVAVRPDWVADESAVPIPEARRQLAAYFAGKLTEFTVPLAAKGTAFEACVWDELRKIPYGTTCSYGEIARRLGRPSASRAVGLANGRNPLSIIVPCHRVIGSNGKLMGYGGGLERKRALLDLESGLPFRT